MDMSISERVDLGVALLDERRPDWRDEVDPDELDMSNSFQCILGQVYRDYDIGLNELGIESGNPFGFDLQFIEGNTNYVTLDAEWRKHL